MRSKVLLCVSGGIAAYKAPELVRQLVAAACEVRVVVTQAAKSFVTELSLAAVSRHPVRSSLLDAAEEGVIGHIELADWPDVVVVAPATADFIARAASGLADDLPTCVLLATRAPVIWAPAMNTNMWHHGATRHNLAVLAARGAEFVGPDRGELACGWVGEGKMIDPREIVEAVSARMARARDLAGLRVMVSAGPTRAHIDPVRFITNASTGAMGFALAEAAKRRGADVVVIAGPVERPTPVGVERVDVETAEQMLASMSARLNAAAFDLVAMVAAVADVAPRTAMQHKPDKDSLMSALAALEWSRTPDVLATLVGTHGSKTMFVGFAAQTLADDSGESVQKQLVDAGTRKLAAKGAHAMFVNPVGRSDTGFGTPTNAGILLVREPGGTISAIDSGVPIAKSTLAHWLLDQLVERLQHRAAP